MSRSKEKSDVIAVIPARGGSKGIPGKNIRTLRGKPLIAWSIEAARGARGIDRVIVSTDDPRIEAVSLEYGAEVIRRPGEISGDTASSESALLHVLDVLEAREGVVPRRLVFLQCTSPLTRAEDIEGTLRVMEEQQAESTLAVTPFHYFLWKPQGDEAVGINHDKRVRPMRQQREPQYLETGAVYAMDVAGFRKAKHRFFGRTAMYVMPRERCLEIDDPVDFTIAEVLLREQEQAGREQRLPKRISALVLDFDGVFTDNRVLVMDDGREAVWCNRSDGWGIGRLKARGVPVVVISTETNPVVSRRCEKLRIPCLQGVDDKAAAMKAWLEEKGLDADGVVYVGNDGNDLGCFAAAGCAVAVADAQPCAVSAARVVLSAPGGRGALREIIELILKRMEETEHA